MSGKERLTRIRKKIASTLMSVFVVAVILSPIYFGVTYWNNQLFGGRDPRKAGELAALQVRPEDKEGTVKPFEEPIITVTFDDGWESIYTEAMPILQEKGIPTTQYILGNTFEDGNYFSIDQVRSMQRAGHEIDSHTMTHPNLTKLNNSALEWEVRESQSVLSQFGKVDDFASPLGAHDDRTIEVIKKYFRSQRNAAGDPTNGVDENDVNTAANFNIYNIKAFTVRTTTTLDDIQRMIDYSVRNNSWMILTYHQIEDTDQGSMYNVKPDDFRKQMELVAKARAKVATNGKVLDTIQAKQ
jgi:peptidoglycan/xylan/chitin deacetylase (PgdA/CDA1 family)